MCNLHSKIVIPHIFPATPPPPPWTFQGFPNSYNSKNLFLLIKSTAVFFFFCKMNAIDFCRVLAGSDCTCTKATVKT